MSSDEIDYEKIVLFVGDMSFRRAREEMQDGEVHPELYQRLTLLIERQDKLAEDRDSLMKEFYDLMQSKAEK